MESDFDTTRLRLGVLCSRGHEWRTTGQSLRRLNGSCAACERLNNQASYLKRRAAGRLARTTESEARIARGVAAFSPVDAAYVAGILDGEGYIAVIRVWRKGDHHHWHQAVARVEMCEREAVDMIAALMGKSVEVYRRHTGKARRPTYRVQLFDAHAEVILRATLPYLRVKKRLAENALAFRELQAHSIEHRTRVMGWKESVIRPGQPAVRTPILGYTDDYLARCESLWAASRDLVMRGKPAAAGGG